MIQFEIVSGKRAGAIVPLWELPFSIGRSDACHLVLKDDGVWEKHAEVAIGEDNRFLIRSEADALTVVNGISVRERNLRETDDIQVGAARLRISFQSARQKRHIRLQEMVTWSGIGIAGLIQWIVMASLP